jgi:hypothetical protein
MEIFEKVTTALADEKRIRDEIDVAYEDAKKAWHELHTQYIALRGSTSAATTDKVMSLVTSNWGKIASVATAAATPVALADKGAFSTVRSLLGLMWPF